MSPHSLLAHWRDRWDKPTAERQRVPYVYGKVKRWSDQFSQAQLWSRTTLWAVLGLLALMLTALLLSVRMALPGQIAASAALVGAAWLAGLATGVWSSEEEVAALWTAGTSFAPAAETEAPELRRRWQAAIGAVRAFAREAQ